MSNEIPRTTPEEAMEITVMAYEGRIAELQAEAARLAAGLEKLANAWVLEEDRQDAALEQARREGAAKELRWPADWLANDHGWMMIGVEQLRKRAAELEAKP